MMRMRTKATAMPPMNGGSGGVGGGGGRGVGEEGEWEVRPGGMLVQKRSDAEENRPPPPTIRVRVKYGSIYHEINISSQATFGELKKMLAGPTGLHHQDQKLLFKDKEKDSKAFLDISGVKDKSKIVLLEDPISLERRYLEMRKNAKMEKASKSISEISLEVDRLASEVSALEKLSSKGVKIVEKDIVRLTELLMNQLVKLDGIPIAYDDVKLQRKIQVKRIQKYVETLDMMKIKNSTAKGNDTAARPQVRGHSSPSQSRRSSSGDVVITTQWETFDSTAAPSKTTPLPSHTVSSTPTTTTNVAQPRFDWDLLL
ncbi:hypothetical protein Leryth_013196 [Lithospermum erythrorhizon]|nr:hypothetical protein Leryth_013196 [Lithospermum erythrorhizon]